MTHNAETEFEMYPKMIMCKSQKSPGVTSWGRWGLALLLLLTGWAGEGRLAAQPANDNLANPSVISGAVGSTGGTNLGATREEPNEPRITDVFGVANPGGASVWFRWTAPFNGVFLFDSVGSNFDVMLASYLNTAGAGNAPAFSDLLKLAEDDDARPALQAAIAFNALAGEEYYIQLDGYNGGFGPSQGNYLVNWTTLTPGNDNCDKPDVISGLSGTVTGRNSGATKQAGEPDHAGNVGGASVWYEWTAPIDGIVAFRTEGSSFNTLLAVYTGDCDTLTEVNSDDDSGPNFSSTVQFSTTAGTVYRIAVDGFNGGAGAATGTIFLSWGYESAAGQFRFASALVFGNNAIYRARESQSMQYGLGLAASDSTIPDLFINPLGAEITVTRINGATGRMLVDYRVSGGTAVAGLDYVPATAQGTLVFDDYQMSASFVVELINRFTIDGTRTLEIEIFNPRPDVAAGENPLLAPALVSPTVAQVQIFDKEISPFGSADIAFARENYKALEGRRVVMAVYKWVTGTAPRLHVRHFNTFALQAGSDYATPDTVPQGNFATGDVDIVTGNRHGFSNPTGLHIFDFTLPDDSVVEFNEDFMVRLETGPEGSPTVHDVASVTILGEHPALPTGAPLNREQPPGAVDRDHNMDDSLLTSPPRNQSPGANGMVFAVATQPDNKSIIGGDFTAFNTSPRNRLARLNVDGSLDTSYNIGTGANGFVAALALQPNGRAVLGGGFTSFNGTGRNRIARLMPDGALDTTFNPGTGINGPVRALAVNTDTNSLDFDKIIVGGEFTSVNSTNRNYIARLSANGQMDSSFNPGTGPNAPVLAIAIQRDGKVVIGGEFTTVGGVPRNRVARLNADGSLDLSFNPGGAADNTVFAVAIDDSGTPLSVSRDAAGNDAEDRFALDTGATSGTVEITYDFLVVPDSIKVYYEGFLLFDSGMVSGTNTVSIPYGPGNSTQVEIVVNEGSLGIPGTLWFYQATVFPSVGIQRVLIGGAFNTVDFRPRNGVARFNADGSLDTSFDPGAGADNTVLAIAMQPDGKAILGGSFTSYNLTRRVGIARLFSNGSLDTGFMDTAYNQFAGLINRLSVDPPNFVRSIAIETNGHVMIGGSFKRVGGGYRRDDARPRQNVARLVGGNIRGPGNIELMESAYTVDENAGKIYISLTRTNGNLGPVSATFATGDRPSGPGAATGGQDYISLVANPVWFSTYNHRQTSQSRMITDALEGPNFASFVNRPLTGFGVTTTSNDVEIDILDNSLETGDQLMNLSLVRPVGTEMLFLGGEHIPLGTALGRSRASMTIVDNDFPHGVLGFASTNFVVDENIGVATFTVVRAEGANGTVTVDYITEDGTATGGVSPGPGIHYLARSGRLTFAAGQTDAVITVPIVDDSVAGPDRVFTVRLFNVSGGAKLNNAIVPVSTQVTIIDNDFLPGSFNFSQGAYSVDENGGLATVTVTRTGGNLGAVAVTVSTSDGTAVAGTDYDATTVTLNWNDGDSSARTVLIPITDNSLVDGNRTVDLTLSAPVGGQLGTVNPTAVLTIVNDDSYGQFVFSASNYTINENGGQATVTVQRIGGSSGAVSVEASVSDGTALAGQHYTNPGVQLLPFADGETSRTFFIAIDDNSTQDGNVNFNLTLSSPLPLGGPASGPILGSPNVATVTIIDNESFNVPAGGVDPTFEPTAGGNNFIYSALVQPNQHLLVGGDFTVMNGVTRTRIARLQDNGLLDPAFDPGLGANGAIRTMALHTNGVHAGRMIIGGSFTTVQGTNRNYIARMNADGLLDQGFNPGAGPDNPVFATTILPDGRVLIGGAFATVDGLGRNGIARLHTNGMMDASFNIGTGANGSVFALARQTDGKILVGGNFFSFNGTNRNYIARLHPDGALDTSFDPGTGANGPVRAIVVQTDGKLVVGGSFTSINGVQRHYLARLESSGAVDSTFNTGFGTGIEGEPINLGANDSVMALLLQPDGKILVGGNFTAFAGVTRNRLTRLNADGTIDSTINFGTGANNFVSSLALQADGKIIAAGGFTTFNNLPRNYLVRLHGGVTGGVGTIEFAAASYTVLENASFATITLRRRGSTAGEARVTVEAVDGTALKDQHYIFENLEVTFPPGETLKTFTIQVIDDNETTPASRSLSLRFVPGSFVNATEPGPQPNATLTIINDDGVMALSSSAYSVNENVVGGNAVITVLRSGASAGTASVGFLTTTNGTAQPGINYTPVSGTISFADGETSKTFSIPIINNDLIEGNKTVQIILTNAIGGQINPAGGLASLTIIDKDRGPGTLNFSLASYSVDEAAGMAVITVVRTNGTTGAISVNYSTSDGTATGGVIQAAGIDYVLTAGTLSFADGENSKSFSIPINLDAESEPDETVNLTLSSPTGGAVLGGQSTARLTIINNDLLLFGNIRFASTNYTVIEGAGLATITVNRIGGTANEISVKGLTFDLTAVDGVHYFGVTNTTDLVWADGENGARTFTVPIVNNDLVDGDKLVGLLLSDVTGGASIGTPGTATLTIEDDDESPGVIGFELAGYSFLESATNAVITVVRTNGITGTVTADFVTSPDTALAYPGAGPTTGFDYTNRVATLTFGPGETNLTIEVGLINNLTQEGDRFVNLTLSEPTGGAVLGLTNAVLTIVDDELAAGTPDPGFIPGDGANGTIYSMSMHPVNRQLILGGDFTAFDSISRSNVARLNSDGTLDTSLNAGVLTLTNGSASVRATALHTSGSHSNKVVIGGSFDVIGGTNRLNVARLNVDGSVDQDFDSNNGANNTVLAVAIQSNGQIIIGGLFTQYGGVSRNFIARLNQDGSLDSTFDPGPGANGAVRAIVIDDNGGVLIGGDFTLVDGVGRNRIARLKPDGKLDKNFDPGSGANGSVRALALQSDGKVLVGGLFTQIDGTTRNRVARLSSIGAIDSTFDPGTGPNDLVAAITLQSDGKLLIGGSFLTVNGVSSPRLARLTASGVLDVTFNVGVGANNFIHAILVQENPVPAQSRIVVAGGFTLFNNAVANRIARLTGGANSGSGQFNFSAPAYSVNEDGGAGLITVVRTGGLAGTSTVVFSTSDGTATAGFDYSAVSETLTFVPGQTQTNVFVPVINNTLIDGNRTVNLSLSDAAGGATTGTRRTAMLTIVNDDGVVGFSSPAYSVNENAGTATITVLRVGGTTGAVSVDFATVDGTAQAGFDYVATTGSVNFAPGQTSASFTVPILNDTLVEGDETLTVTLANLVPTSSVILGLTNAVLTIIDDDFMPGVLLFEGPEFFVNENEVNAVITVLRTDGTAGTVSVEYSASSGTATGGLAPVPGVNDFIAVTNMLTFADGESAKSFQVPIVDDFLLEGDETVILTLSNPLGGATLAGSGVFGELDTNFNLGGGPDGVVNSMALQNDQRILVAGAFGFVDNVPLNRIARLMSDGSVDDTFIPGLGADAAINAVVLQLDGQILIGGSFTDYDGVPMNRIARLDTFGALDPTFNIGTGVNGEVRAIAFNSVGTNFGRVLIAGDFTIVNGVPRNRIAQLNADGSVDLSFDPALGADAIVNAVAVQADGSILIGGGFTSVDGATFNRIARLNSDGSVDTSFVPGTGADAAVNTLAVQADGRILIGGAFTTFNGVARNRVARLNPNGSLDPTFDAGAGPNAAINHLVLQADGRIVIGGAFTMVAGISRNRVDRLNTNGTRDTGFDPGAGADGVINALALQNDGKLLIGGGFTMFNGIDIIRIARLQTSAAVGLATALLTIVDNDVLLGFTASDFSAIESNTNLTFEVTRAGLMDQTFDVEFATVDVTAIGGFDYLFAGGLLTFGPGETNKTFQVSILDDTEVEGDETFQLQLSSPTGASLIGITNATVTIVDNDLDYDLAVTVAVNEPIYTNSIFTYIVTVTNRGPSTVNGVILSNTLPAELTFLGQSNSANVGYAQLGNTLLFDLGTVAAGGSTTVWLTNQVPGTPMFVSNTAEAGPLTFASAADTDPANNSFTHLTRIREAMAYMVDGGIAVITESLSPANGAIDPNETVTLNLTLRNIGNRNTTNLVATLLATGGVVSPSGAQTYGALSAFGGAAARPFSFTVQGSEGDTVTATLQLRDGSFVYDDVLYTFVLGTTSPSTNPEVIDIVTQVPTQSGNANPFPSTIDISGQVGIISKITLTLHDLTHTFPDDLDILLVSPWNERVLVMSDAGGGFPITTNNAITITLDDNAAAVLPDAGPLTTGSFRPMNYLRDEAADIFPVSPPYRETLAAFNGVSANGTWSLYVVDDSEGDSGAILSGWTLNITSVTPVSPTAGLSLAVTAQPAPVMVGSNLLYTLAVTNYGPHSATNVWITNTLPANVTLVDAVAGQGTAVPSGNNVLFDLGILNPGEFVTSTLEVIPRVAGTLTNIASVTSNQVDPYLGNNTAVTLTTAAAVADLAVGVNATPNPVALGNNLTYSILVTNLGPSTATNVVVSNTLPSSVNVISQTTSQGLIARTGTLVTANLGTLASNATATVTIVVTPTMAGTITNVASVTSPAFDPNTTDNTAVTVVATVTSSADLSVTLDNVPNPVVAGTELVYTAVVSNHGPSTATSVVLTNALPGSVTFNSASSSQGTTSFAGSVLTASLGNLSVGSSATVTIRVTPQVPGSLNNTVGVGAGTADPVPANNTQTVTTTVLEPAEIVGAGATLLVESFSPSNGMLDPGETVTLALALRNKSGADTSSLVATLLPTGGVTSPSAPQNYGALLDGGAVQSRNFTFTVSGALGGTITATLRLQDGAMDLGTVKFVFKLGEIASFANAAEILVPEAGPASAYPSTINISGVEGTIIQMTATLHGVSHTFPDDLDVLLVSPSGKAVVLMSDAGGSAALNGVTLTFSDAAAVFLPDGSLPVITNGTYKPSSYAGNDEANEAYPSPAPAGPYDTTMAAFKDTNPNGVWSLYVVDDQAGDSGRIAGGWSLTLTTVTTVNPSVDLAVTMSDTPDPVVVGELLTYSVLISNRGPNQATNVVATHTLPGGVSLISANSSQGTADTSVPGVVTGNLGSIAAGGSATMTVVVKPNAVGSITNQVAVTSALAELNGADNTALAITVVEGVMLSSTSTGPINGSGFQLLLSGRSGMTYVIEVSSDLVNWSPISTNSTLSGAMEFIDTNASSFNQRFYRALEK